ncbi:hypothetical protein BD413DRAFT_495685 [Trametes elegans]|nr:hypothetical protein BD413DRAFT_495685 [Trametes elegans]
MPYRLGRLMASPGLPTQQQQEIPGACRLPRSVVHTLTGGDAPESGAGAGDDADAQSGPAGGDSCSARHGGPWTHARPCFLVRRGGLGARWIVRLNFFRTRARHVTFRTERQENYSAFPPGPDRADKTSRSRGGQRAADVWVLGISDTTPAGTYYVHRLGRMGPAAVWVPSACGGRAGPPAAAVPCAAPSAPVAGRTAMQERSGARSVRGLPSVAAGTSAPPAVGRECGALQVGRHASCAGGDRGSRAGAPDGQGAGAGGSDRSAITWGGAATVGAMEALQAPGGGKHHSHCCGRGLAIRSMFVSGRFYRLVQLRRRRRERAALGTGG